ncbi:MAG: YbaK/EbsC family protein, partial [Saezia sp.]
TSEEAAQVRGNRPEQAAKAMVMRVKISSKQYIYVHAVLPGDKRIDFAKVAQAVGGVKASLATAEEAEKITDCIMGAVPPVSFNEQVELIVDPLLLSNNDELFFNAGLRERSINIRTQDYVRIVQPTQVPLLKVRCYAKGFSCLTKT